MEHFLLYCQTLVFTLYCRSLACTPQAQTPPCKLLQHGIYQIDSPAHAFAQLHFSQPHLLQFVTLLAIHTSGLPSHPLSLCLHIFAPAV